MPSILLILVGIFVFASFLSLTFFMQTKHDETIKRRRSRKREAELMFKQHWDMIRRQESIDYFERYGNPKQKEEDEEDLPVSEIDGPVIIQDLGDGRGIGPDGDIYIISRRETKDE